MIIGGIEMNEKEHEILSGRLMKIIEKYAYDKDVREELHTYLICAADDNLTRTYSEEMCYLRDFIYFRKMEYENANIHMYVMLHNIYKDKLFDLEYSGTPLECCIFDLLCQAERSVIFDYISKFASCEKNDDGYYIWKINGNK